MTGSSELSLDLVHPLYPRKEIAPLMKKFLSIVLLTTGVIVSGFAQRTSLNNYTGIWENNASWVGGIAPPVANPAVITAAHLNLTINGYITRNGNITLDNATSAEDFIINDTLVVLGNMFFPNDAAELVIGPSGVLIVMGNAEFRNNTRITNNGIFTVSGALAFANGASDIYDNSGGGELFVQGAVTDNTQASGADNWDNLDTIYPRIYDFMMCGGGSSCALPIKLSYFKVKLKHNIVELKWATTMEENFQKFVVQRSADGISFENIGELPGKGFNIYDIVTKYDFVDELPMVGLNYYRLKAVDLNDSFEYFQVEMVHFKGEKHLSVYPNPSTGESIAFNFNVSPQETDRVILTDPLGAEIFNASATSVKDRIFFRDKLRPGIYVLRYLSEDFEQTSRVIVRN